MHVALPRFFLVNAFFAIRLLHHLYASAVVGVQNVEAFLQRGQLLAVGREYVVGLRSVYADAAYSACIAAGQGYMAVTVDGMLTDVTLSQS